MNIRCKFGFHDTDLIKENTFPPMFHCKRCDVDLAWGRWPLGDKRTWNHRMKFELHFQSMQADIDVLNAELDVKISRVNILRTLAGLPLLPYEDHSKDKM